MTSLIGEDRHTRYYITDDLTAYFHFWKLGFDVKYKPKNANEAIMLYEMAWNRRKKVNNVDRLLSQMGKISNEYKQL